VGIKETLAERTAAIRTLLRRTFKQWILKIVVIRRVTMLWMIWLLLVIKINGSKIRKD